jgi:hypothetical protein
MQIIFNYIFFVIIFKKNRIENFENEQDYHEIKKKYSKIKLFTDSKFKTNNDSIFYTDNFKEWLQHEKKLDFKQEIVWKRAKVRLFFFQEKKNKF